MIDSGVTQLFIHEDFCRQHRIFTVPLEDPITVYNIDRTLNKTGTISRKAVLKLTVGSYTFKEEFLVTNLSVRAVSTIMLKFRPLRFAFSGLSR